MKAILFAMVCFLSLSLGEAFAAAEDFEVDCTIYTMLPNDPFAMTEIRQDNLFKVTVKNKIGSVKYGTGPGTRQSGAAINWETISPEGTVEIVKKTRWTIELLFNNGNPVRVFLQQSSRSNTDVHFIDADFSFPNKFSLKSGHIIDSFNAGFCVTR